MRASQQSITFLKVAADQFFKKNRTLIKLWKQWGLHGYDVMH